MSCPNSTMLLGPVPVWTSGSTSTWQFHPLSEPRGSDAISKARISIELSQSTPNIKARPALRMSNDGQTWDSPVTVGTDVQTGDGVTYADGYETISATLDGKQLVQFGVEVANVTGSAYEQAMASLKVDLA